MVFRREHSQALIGSRRISPLYAQTILRGEPAEWCIQRSLDPVTQLRIIAKARGRLLKC